MGNSSSYDTPALPAQSRGRQLDPPLSLSILPTDILLHICDFLLQDLQAWFRPTAPTDFVPRVEDHVFGDTAGFVRGSHALDSLSATSKAFRAICLPSLFRSMTLRAESRDPSPPPSILLYVCVLRYIGSDVASSIRHDHMILLTRMPNIREIRCYRAGMARVPCDNLNLACVAPALQFLYLNDLHPTTKDMTIPCPQLPLRLLKIISSGRFPVLGTIPVASLVDSCNRLEALLGRSRSTMEELVLPGESTRLSFLSFELWPRVRTLVLCGAVPALDTTFLHVLLAMPNLGSLTLALAPRDGSPPLVLWPADSDADPSMQPDLRQLHHLAVTYPQANERIFEHLSLNLRTLAIRDMPRYWARKLRLETAPSDPVQIYAAPLTTYSALRRIMETFDGALVERLEVVVLEDAFEAQALAQVARSCPNLHFFELHRYRRVVPGDWTYQDPTSTPIAEISRHLSVLTSIRTLRVNIDLYTGGFSPSRDWDAWDDLIASIAQTIVDSLSWLQYIAILCLRINGDTTWRTWAVHRGVNGKALLTEDDRSWDWREQQWM
ncbi:hypothetical protein EXIGLDRAFT_372261 [Exidia glandulosa HHB12029]|uniref:F-box domain-containing protein n=1 Tax=Exidia glandulosa HHB12029 TaxID=1314781 RepID=A0A165PWE5_EXIGL|nr:hypothetical protein EXIGLDRAFT_372261 [Exidia glandulosa HHB12029]